MKLCVLCDSTHGYLEPCTAERSVNIAILIAAKEGITLEYLRRVYGL